MGARDQDVARKGFGMRQRRHLGHVPARDRCRSCERQRRGGTGCHQPGLRSGRIGDAGTGGILQLPNIDRASRRGGHGFDDFRRHDRAAQPG
jgi:hypothetical protein